MLFRSKSEEQRIKQIAENSDDTLEGAVRRAREILSIDPEHNGALRLLAAATFKMGDVSEARRILWDALAASPLDPVSYTMLSTTYRLDLNVPVEEYFSDMSIWWTGLSAEVPELIARNFKDPELPNVRDLDFNDPNTYYSIAKGREREQGWPKLSPELEERLLPYNLLLELARGVFEGIDSKTLDRIQTHADVCMPLWRLAVKSTILYFEGADFSLVQILVALLGEFAGPEALDDLWELALQANPGLFSHVHWALSRMAVRFPVETVAGIRAAIPQADACFRCALAEHLICMPEVEGADRIMLSLLDDFPRLAKEPDAPNLLGLVQYALTCMGHIARAREVLARYERLLPKESRRWLNEELDEGFTPRLEGLRLQDLDIEDICIDRALLQDDFGQEDEDFHFGEEGEEEEEDPDEPEVRVKKPGRNDPCWCGSGKKYKKCHLQVDEEAERGGHTDVEHDDPLVAKAMDGLLTTAERLINKREMVRAGMQFYGANVDSEEKMKDGSLPFLYWYLLDYRSEPSGRTAMEEHIRRHGSRLDPQVLSLLEAWRDSRYGLFEVTEVKAGESSRFTDVFTGEEVRLTDRDASLEDIEGMVLARLAKQGERFGFMQDVISVPRRAVAGLMDFIEIGARSAGVAPADFVRSNIHRLHRVIQESE